MMVLKNRIKKNPAQFRWMIHCYNRILGKNRIRVAKGNHFLVGSSLMKNVHLEIQGTDNEVIIEDLVQMDHLTIHIQGNHNRLVIGRENGFDHCSLWMEDDYNAMEIGEHNRFFEGSQLAALEGTKISIGADGLYAKDVQVRTSDSHSVLDTEGKRINPARDISIGNHVWLGDSVMVLKGSVIPDDVVVGARSLVNKHLESDGGMYVGTPAHLVKKNINWTSKRV